MHCTIILKVNALHCSTMGAQCSVPHGEGKCWETNVERHSHLSKDAQWVWERSWSITQAMNPCVGLYLSELCRQLWALGFVHPLLLVFFLHSCQWPGAWSQNLAAGAARVVEEGAGDWKLQTGRESVEVPRGQTHTGLMSSWLWGWTILCYVQMFGRTFRPDLSIWFFGLVWGFFGWGWENEFGNKTDSKTRLLQSTVSTSRLSGQGTAADCFQRMVILLAFEPPL